MRHAWAWLMRLWRRGAARSAPTSDLARVLEARKRQLLSQRYREQIRCDVLLDTCVDLEAREGKDRFPARLQATATHVRQSHVVVSFWVHVEQLPMPAAVDDVRIRSVQGGTARVSRGVREGFREVIGRCLGVARLSRVRGPSCGHASVLPSPVRASATRRTEIESTWLVLVRLVGHVAGKRHSLNLGIPVAEILYEEKLSVPQSRDPFRPGELFEIRNLHLFKGIVDIRVP